MGNKPAKKSNANNISNTKPKEVINQESIDKLNMSSCVENETDKVEPTEQKEDTQNETQSAFPSIAQTLVRQYSGDLNASDNNDDENIIFSLSDDENSDETKYENMIDFVKEQLITQKYAKLDTKMKEIAQKCRCLILGFSRLYYKGFGTHIMPYDVLFVICDFYPPLHMFCWNPKYISLKSFEEENAQIFIIPKPFCCLSNLLKPLIESNTAEMFKVQQVSSHMLELVVRYLAHHRGIKPSEFEKPLRSADMRQVCSDVWDAEFINELSQESVYELILAANYMDLKSLLDLGCAKIASLIKGKSPEQIRKTFNIENDFSPEEEEAVRAENAWAEDA